MNNTQKICKYPCPGPNYFDPVKVFLSVFLNCREAPIFDVHRKIREIREKSGKFGRKNPLNYLYYSMISFVEKLITTFALHPFDFHFIFR